MRSQEKTVRALHGNSDDSVALWETRCSAPRLVDDVNSQYFNGNGGTYPVCILEKSLAVDQIKSSDLWVLLTGTYYTCTILLRAVAGVVPRALSGMHVVLAS